MSGVTEPGSPRPRPLSGGFWTLLSWLRREDQSSSNESLSSAGSDRTVASFAFLTPAHYHPSAPIILPPPGPPTDTYKCRVRERNLRRQYERDLTLHRKYGLLRGEGGGYDAFSLPGARRGGGERVRRAASESARAPPRPAHVPGKRRAPPPPTLPTTARRRATKRPAPQPPKVERKSKENSIHPSPGDGRGGSYRATVDAKEVNSGLRCAPVFVETECKQVKYTKMDLRDAKVKPDKSFLKQIFENKKRNSADVSVLRVLPSISELDKQAAEIIENNRMKCAKEKNRQIATGLYDSGPADVLPSTSDTKLHNSSICTQTENKLQSPGRRSTNAKDDEKQKLKDMLKEMKDSLPKRPKHEMKDNTPSMKEGSPTLSAEGDNHTDTPTLRIGSSNFVQTPKSTAAYISSEKIKEALPKKEVEVSTETKTTQIRKTQAVVPDKCKPSDQNQSSKLLETTVQVNELHTPLKISSLLNPIYVPRTTTAQVQQTSNTIITEVSKEDMKPVEKKLPPQPIYVKTADTVRDIILNSALPCSPLPTSSQPSKSYKAELLNTPSSSKEQVSVSKELPHPRTSNLVDSPNKNVERLSEHSRRRELVNQLEQSIAKGDERAAADAAAKLAQLRLSCSVLSFTSQILAEPSTSTTKITDKIANSTQSKKCTASKKNTEPLPDLVKTEVVSSKLAKSSQTSDSRVTNMMKNTTDGSVTKINDQKIKSKIITTLAGTPKETKNDDIDNKIASLKIWIEDKEKARGPIQLNINRDANVGELRYRVEKSLGLPARLQRWIVGRALCTDDNTPLISLAGPTLSAPFYLCLVESDANKNEIIQVKTNKPNEENQNIPKNNIKTSGDVYSELVNLERQALVPNTEVFECEICMEVCNPGDGVVLRECVHSFCKACLSDVIHHCQEPSVSCPATGCPGELHEREIRALVSGEEYQRWLARGLAAAESSTRNAFHCRTRDCTGWASCDKDVRRFPCPVCKHTNCVPCQAIHENQTCEEYQTKLQEAANISNAEKTDEGTRALIDGLISRGEALECPECSAVITKKWGCDWVKCSACKTEICWVTRGRRWGPGGRGDTSGGCRCGVDGKRCHPSCGYCH